MHAGSDVADAALARVMARSKLASRGFLVIESDGAAIALARLAVSTRPATAIRPRPPSKTTARDVAIRDGGL